MISGKRILVTGSSGWIGEGISLALLEAGAEVICHHRSQLPASLQNKVHAVVGDLRSVAAIDSIVNEVREHFGTIDGLVNNAAAQPVTPFLEITEAEYNEVMDSGFKSAFFLTQRLAPLMSAGAVVNVASIEGEFAPPGHAHYGAAKAALLSLTRSLALELAPIRVNAVLPGLIERPGIEDAWPEGVKRWRESAPLVRLGRREDVAQAVLFLLTQPWITGSGLHVDGGMHARSW